MLTNSLEIFKQLFQKISKDIKNIFFLTTPYIEEKDHAITTFLAVEYLELIWLIRVLYVEYDKQFLITHKFHQSTVKNIARSITLSIDEIRTIDY